MTEGRINSAIAGNEVPSADFKKAPFRVIKSSS